MRRAWALVFLCTAVLASPGEARADGQKALTRGIRLYEQLQVEKACVYLETASRAEDLSEAERAQAFLYLGLAAFEGGDRAKALGAWRRALELDPGIRVPEGTTPKAVDAIEVERARRARAEGEAVGPPEERPGAEGKAGDEPAPDASPTAEAPAPESVQGSGALRDPRVPGDVTAATALPKARGPSPLEAHPAAASSDSGPRWWLWAGLGGAVAIGVAVALVVALAPHSDCQGGGGCIAVTLQ